MGSVENLSLIEKRIEIDNASVVVVISKLGNKEGLTGGQCAELFGCTPSNIRDCCSRNRINSVCLTGGHLQLLKDNGVIGSRAPSANFYDRDAIEDILFHIGTPKAKQIYKQLWKEYQYALVELDRKSKEISNKEKILKANDALIAESENRLALFKQDSLRLRKALDEETKLKEQAIKQRAWISNKREATVMQRLGAVMKKVAAQAVEIIGLRKIVELKHEDLEKTKGELDQTKAETSKLTSENNKLKDNISKKDELIERKDKRLTEEYHLRLEKDEEIKELYLIVQNSSLNARQVTIVNSAIYKKILQFGWKSSATGWFYQRIKEYAGISNIHHATYKDISQWQLPVVLDYLTSMEVINIPKEICDKYHNIRSDYQRTKMCFSKNTYPTEQDAKDIIRICKLREQKEGRDTDFDYYRCPECGGFHITKMV